MTDIKREYQDSVFTNMFGREDKEYLLELYKALHPDDKSIQKDDINLVTIENVIANDIYNDLGFIAREKLVILLEAQSTWSPNIIARMFIYLARTYRDYIFNNRKLKSKLYSKSKIELPSPELYVIYTGYKDEKPEFLSLKDEFFADCAFGLDLKAKVIYADDGRRDIIGQYITFCMVVKKQLLLHNDKKKALEEAIRICIENGDLARYLTEHRKEVEDVMFTLLTQEEAKESYGDYRYDEGLEVGLEKGLEEGLIALINATKPLCKDFKSLYNIVISQKPYADLTEEEVKKYY